MMGLTQGALCCLLLAVAAAQNRARDRVQPSGVRVQGGDRPASRSWNTQLYPVWHEGTSQRRDCWRGGEVSFAAANDGPTLVAAKTTFSIQLNFPHNQTVSPDGQVVWGQNCSVNGTHAAPGEPVYPDFASEGSDCVFPDGQRFPPGSERRRSKFVYVWQTWGKYWQVIDGPSSRLTIDTEGVALGSYPMEVVVYHYRGRQQFIPMGRATSQFTITDQVPFSVSISQILDVDEADSRFVQNRAIAFSVQVHDPSQYLRDADISYSWDFGDQSGTLLTHVTAVTHTYVSTGSFRPQVVLQAAIPLPACTSTPADTTGAPEDPTASEPAGGTTGASSIAPVSVAPEGSAAPEPAAPTTPASAAETPATITPASAAETPATTTLASAAETPAITTPASAAEIPATTTPASAAETPAATTPASAAETPATTTVTGEAAGTPATAMVTGEAAGIPEGTDENLEVDSVAPEIALPSVAATPEDTNSPLANTVAPVETTETELPAEASPELAVAEGTQTVAEATQAVTILSESPAGAAVTTKEPEAATDPAVTAVPGVATSGAAALPAAAAAVDESLVLVKRQAIENQPNDCLLYRYGSYATNLDIVEGIEQVEIVQVVPALATSGQENAVDFTVTCQGSIPSDVCTTISDPDCLSPLQTVCSPVPPQSDCQLVLRQLFNRSGDFCVNVSLTNAVSLAVASAQVHISEGFPASAGFGAFVGVLVLGLVLAGVAYTYSRHVKRYTLLSEAPAVERSSRWIPDSSSLRLFFRNALGHPLSGESSPLLSGNLV